MERTDLWCLLRSDLNAKVMKTCQDFDFVFTKATQQTEPGVFWHCLKLLDLLLNIGKKDIPTCIWRDSYIIAKY